MFIPLNDGENRKRVNGGGGGGETVHRVADDDVTMVHAPFISVNNEYMKMKD